MRAKRRRISKKPDTALQTEIEELERRIAEGKEYFLLISDYLVNILLWCFLKIDTEYIGFIVKFLSNFIDLMKNLPKSFFFATWAFY